MKGLLSPALAIILLLLFAPNPPAFAQRIPSAEYVTRVGNKTLLHRAGESTFLKTELALPADIKVFTNGMFRVKTGKLRLLKDQQILYADGNLLNPDGSIEPVFDHITLRQNNVVIIKDGEVGILESHFTMPDGTTISPDASYTRPGGRHSRFVAGQLVTLDGAMLGGLDTICFRDGRSVVYKAGVSIPLQFSAQIMGMYDGTRVRGDGLITFHDGTTLQLTEGQTISVEGVRAGY